MALFEKNESKVKEHKGLLKAFQADIIKWEPEGGEEADVIVHKFEYEDFPNGSQLIVHPSQMAIFINNVTAGSSSEGTGAGQTQVSTFVGPCKIKLETGDSRFAPFRVLTNALTGGESAFHSTVYFVNTTYMNELNWGTQAPVVVMDPEEEVNVHVRAYGLFGVHIEHEDEGLAVIQASKILRKIVGTKADYTRSELISFMRAKILEYVPDLLAKNMVDKEIGILKISTRLSEFSATIYEKLKVHFDEFGLTLDNFSFHNINAPDEDLRAINEMKIARKRAQLEAEGNARKMDIESAARARQREREGYTYQQEQSFDVLRSAAENEGGVSATLMGAGLGLGMGVGVGGFVTNGMQGVAQNTLMGNMGALTGTGTVSNQENMKECPACKAKVPATSKFCVECGTKIEQDAVCPECGAKVTPGAKFCASCGHKLQTEAFCPECGAKLAPGTKFCSECGTKM